LPFGPWESFDACVADMLKQGHDEDSAKRICGALKARLEGAPNILEGNVSAGDKNLIHGEALHPVKTFHPEEWPNVRVYLEEELAKAAGTLVGKPLLLDHQRLLDGKVLEARYEDGAIKYVAELNDPEILEKIRSGGIKHVSVEYDWRSLERLDGVAPRGIEFVGLSLLEKYEPGDPNASVNVWESLVKRLRDAEEKRALQKELSDAREKIKALEAERAELVKRLGEAIIEPNAKPVVPRGYIHADEVLKRIPRWIPGFWGHGPFEVLKDIRDVCLKAKRGEL
jgi:hypothetical protein